MCGLEREDRDSGSADEFEENFQGKKENGVHRKVNAIFVTRGFMYLFYARGIKQKYATEWSPG